MKLTNRILSRRGFISTSLLSGLIAPFLNPKKVDAAPMPSFAPPMRVTFLPTGEIVLPSISTTHTKLADIGTLTVQDPASLIEIIYEGRLRVDSMTGYAAYFYYKIDNLTKMGGHLGTVHSADAGTYFFVSFTEFFQGVPAGDHIVSCWVYMQNNSGTNAKYNAGILAGSCFVKEYLPFGTTYLPLVTK